MRVKSLKLLAAVAGVLCLTLGSVAPASAFIAENTGGFTFGSESTVGGPNAGAGKAVSFFGLATDPTSIPGTQYGTIGWGAQSGASVTTATDPFSQTGPPTSAARSALRVDTFQPVMLANGPAVVIATLTHANRTIFIPFLDTVTIDTRLRIMDGSTEANSTQNSSVITLHETGNNAGGCDPDIQIPLTADCSDYFTFPFTSFEPIPFSYNGDDYVVIFDLIPGGGTIFEPINCADPAGAPDLDGTCGRIRTAEGQTNTIDITARLVLIPDEEVPAPASVLLLGAALASIATASRLRRGRKA